MDAGALIASIVFAVSTVWMLISGSAGIRLDLWRREDEPLVYWSVVALGLLGTAVTLVMAFRG
jgi:hypothetical protein